MTGITVSDVVSPERTHAGTVHDVLVSGGAFGLSTPGVAWRGYLNAWVVRCCTPHEPASAKLPNGRQNCHSNSIWKRKWPGGRWPAIVYWLSKRSAKGLPVRPGVA